MFFEIASIEKVGVANSFDLRVFDNDNFYLSSGILSHNSGKTTSGELEIENWYLMNSWQKKRRYKIIDFDTSGRFENCSYSLPENDPSMINRMLDFPDWKQYSLRPMSFPDEVLLFNGRNLLSYPKIPGNFKIVSFSMSDINLDTMKNLLGGTEALEATLNSFQLKFGFEVTMQDLWDVLFKGEFRGKKQMMPGRVDEKLKNMIKVRIQSWLQTGLFSDKVEKLDFAKIFNDYKTITCFNSALTFTDKEEEIAYSIVLQKAWDFCSQRKVDPRLIFFIREIHDYIEYKSCRPLINQVLRKGRTLGKTGIDLICDTQRPTDLPPMLRRQFSYYYQLQGDFRDAEKMLEIRYIPKHDLERVTRFGTGKGMLVTGARYDAPIEFAPTRHKHVSPKSDILKDLAKVHGWQTIDVDEILGGLNEAYQPEEPIKEVNESGRRRA